MTVFPFNFTSGTYGYFRVPFLQGRNTPSSLPLFLSVSLFTASKCNSSPRSFHYADKTHIKTVVSLSLCVTNMKKKYAYTIEKIENNLYQHKAWTKPN